MKARPWGLRVEVKPCGVGLKGWVGWAWGGWWGPPGCGARLEEFPAYVRFALVEDDVG